MEPIGEPLPPAVQESMPAAAVETSAGPVGMASWGKPYQPATTAATTMEVPSPAEWETMLPGTEDVSDLRELSRQMRKWSHLRSKASQAASEAYGRFMAAKNAYDHAYAVALTGKSGGSEKSRIAAAELDTEDLRVARDTAEVVWKRHVSVMHDARHELENLWNQSHNVRSEVNLSS